MPPFQIKPGQIFRATKGFAEAVGDPALMGKKICYESQIPGLMKPKEVDQPCPLCSMAEAPAPQPNSKPKPKPKP